VQVKAGNGNDLSQFSNVVNVGQHIIKIFSLEIADPAQRFALTL
jgi:hypothetical protein